jgi:Ribose/xylose/arabinose/galactoside ABC-type transport systems, permease components
MGIYRGLTTWLSQGGAITLRSPDIHSLYRPAYFGSVLGVPVPIIIIVVTAAVGAFVLNRTRYGRHVLAWDRMTMWRAIPASLSNACAR